MLHRFSLFQFQFLVDVMNTHCFYFAALEVHRLSPGLGKRVAEFNRNVLNNHNMKFTLIALVYVQTWGGDVETVMVSEKLFPLLKWKKQQWEKIYRISERKKKLFSWTIQMRHDTHQVVLLCLRWHERAWFTDTFSACSVESKGEVWEM